jgi:type II secretory pathway component GspD/PulD (secretin)
MEERQTSGLKMRETLKKKVDITFGDMEIAEAIRALGQLTNSNIVLDSRAFAEIERKGSPKVNIRLKDVPLEVALSAIVRSVGLNYTIHDHYVFVTTPYRGPNQAINGTAARTNRMRGGAGRSIGGRNSGGRMSRGRR